MLCQIKHPEAKSIIWAQYTPYFNDGDTCVFGVNDWELNVKSSFIAPDIKELMGDSDDDGEDYHYGEEDYIYYAEQISGNHSWNKPAKPRKLTEEESTLIKDFKELESACMGIDEVLQIVLGDHVKIVATKKGFDIDSYDHD